MKTEFLLTILVTIAAISAGLAGNLLTRMFSHPTKAEQFWFAVLMVLAVICVIVSVVVCLNSQIAARRVWWFAGALLLAAAAVFCVVKGFDAKEVAASRKAPDANGILSMVPPAIVEPRNQVAVPAPAAPRPVAPATVPAPQPEPLPPIPVAQGPAQHFFGMVGCAYMEGVPDKMTAYSGLSADELRMRVDDFAKTIRVSDIDRTRKLQAAASLTIEGLDEAALASRRQEEIEKVGGQVSEAWQNGLMKQAHPLFDELHVRLQRPYPRSVADGITVGGFSAVCGGLLRGPHPLTDLGTYMRALADRVP